MGIVPLFRFVMRCKGEADDAPAPALRWHIFNSEADHVEVPRSTFDLITPQPFRMAKTASANRDVRQLYGVGADRLSGVISHCKRNAPIEEFLGMKVRNRRPAVTPHCGRNSAHRGTPWPFESTTRNRRPGAQSAQYEDRPRHRRTAPGRCPCY